jgi:hypothetical protein
MDPQLLQRTRYVLRSRVRRTQTCPASLFPSACKHLVDWVSNHPVFSSLIKSLEATENESIEQIRYVTEQGLNSSQDFYNEGRYYDATSIEEHSSICWLIVKAVSQATKKDEVQVRRLYNGIHNYIVCDEDFVEIEKSIETIRDVAVEGLFEYLDERLDSRNVIYSLLIKYKERSEWFHRSRLRKVADEGLEGKTGERGLAVDLQEYVFNQQVEFIIEPVSSSGETDLILKDPEGRRLILDAKYVKENAERNEIVKKIRDGIHQLYRYEEDYNEPEGFLVVFVRTKKRIAPELEQSDGLRFIKLGGKIIYYLEVHISDEPSASLSGRAEEVHISRDELVKSEEEASE